MELIMDKWQVTLYTDGAARGNPEGPGGYGAVLQYRDQKGSLHEREYSCGFSKTTNNRMELLAVIVGLEALTKPCQVDLYSDSQYVVKPFTEHWIDAWKKKGWRTSGNDEVKNRALWERLLAAMKGHEVTFNWVKGHAGHPENERCDRLATSAADGEELYIDDGGDLRNPLRNGENDG